MYCQCDKLEVECQRGKVVDHRWQIKGPLSYQSSNDTQSLHPYHLLRHAPVFYHTPFAVRPWRADFWWSVSCSKHACHISEFIWKQININIFNKAVETHLSTEALNSQIFKFLFDSMLWRTSHCHKELLKAPCLRGTIPC